MLTLRQWTATILTLSASLGIVGVIIGGLRGGILGAGAAFLIWWALTALAVSVLYRASRHDESDSH